MATTGLVLVSEPPAVAKSFISPGNPRPSHHRTARVIRDTHLHAQMSSTRADVVHARDYLLDLIADQQRGLATQKDPEKRAHIVSAIDVLTALGDDMNTTSHKALSATWRMLWTTEKEQLFIIEKAHLFGTGTGDILQVIDVEGQRLNNVITFPPDGAFVVDSVIEVASPQRVNFRFTGASLRGSGWRIPIPPIGQGWFSNVYVDDEIRVAKDIRGDYLVVEKAPYMWSG